MASYRERTAHSVNRMFSLLCVFVALVVSHFGFDGWTLVLIASVPGHCQHFTFHITAVFSVPCGGRETSPRTSLMCVCGWSFQL